VTAASLPTEAEFVDDACARRNALILAGAQTLYGASTLVAITTGGLIGQALAADKALATLPISTLVIGTALATVPMSLFMKRVGRRIGFMCGAGFGLLSAVLAVVAIYQQSFWLFALATFFNGVYQASAQFYRFAAADVASERFRPQAISWVMVGGLLTAVVGPQIVIWTRDMLAPVLFAGAFVSTAILSVLAMALLSFVTIPLPKANATAAPARPLAEIMLQPKFVVAVACAMISFGIMNLVMTATPIAMLACALTVDDAAWVIQWHVVAMFAPSFFTGGLIRRFGARTIIAVGLTLLSGCGIVALAGVSIGHFSAALVLLGLGWNFGFIGATTLVTETYLPSERAKVQGANDFLVFGTVALASLSSGVLLQLFGWGTVNVALFPMVAIAFVLIAWLALKERREAIA
jgi:MFS family permease